MKSVFLLTVIVLSILFFSGCGEEEEGAASQSDAGAATASPDEKIETITAGQLSLTPPSALWHQDEELASMITLKYGESSPHAVARFYFNGRDTVNFDSLSKSGQEKFLEELAFDLRGQIEQITKSQAEFISGPEYLSEPYPGVSWCYQDTVGDDDYFNLDTVFYVDGRYAFLDLACYLAEQEKLAKEFELLLSSATINEEEIGESSLLQISEEIQLHLVSLTMTEAGWKLSSFDNELFLSKDGSTLHLYRRQPRTGAAEGSGLLDGMLQEITAQWGEVELLERQLSETKPLAHCTQEYQISKDGELRWHYDSILIVEEEYYLLEAEAAANLSAEEREQLIELVENLTTMN